MRVAILPDTHFGDSQCQLARILGPDKFFHFQTSLDKASDDLDNASAANVEALRAEVQEILTTQKNDIQQVCERVGKA